eukprot:Tbor_TRINITY_DN5637_c1_g2::TRINITY_DN5637_c1_g2_i1::g.8908::m.8908
MRRRPTDAFPDGTQVIYSKKTVESPHRETQEHLEEKDILDNINNDGNIEEFPSFPFISWILPITPSAKMILGKDASNVPSCDKQHHNERNNNNENKAATIYQWQVKSILLWLRGTRQYSILFGTIEMIIVTTLFGAPLPPFGYFTKATIEATTDPIQLQYPFFPQLRLGCCFTLCFWLGIMRVTPYNLLLEVSNKSASNECIIQKTHTAYFSNAQTITILLATLVGSVLSPMDWDVFWQVWPFGSLLLAIGCTILIGIWNVLQI